MKVSKIRNHFLSDWPSEACIACGTGFLFTGYPDLLFDECDEWKRSKGVRQSMVVKAEDIENMYFHKRPWVWTTFVRAIIHRPHIDHIGISGIGQTFLGITRRDIPQVPRDDQKAHIGNPYDESLYYLCTRYRPFDMLNPEKEVTAESRSYCEQIGYPVHAHCWILVDRVIGFGLIETNLKIFIKALENFWVENRELWLSSMMDESFEDEPYPAVDLSSDELQNRDNEDPYVWRNPLIIPEIQEITEQASRVNCGNSNISRTQLSIVSQIPVEIAMQITDLAKPTSITDTRNMLIAFGWRLPDNYWQSCCRMDLIFEYEDLRRINTPVDWQFIALATEELLTKSGVDKRCGLRNRHRTFQLLKQIKSVFLGLLEQDRTNPGCLFESPRRKYPLRKSFL